METFQIKPREAMETPDPNYERKIRSSFEHQGAMEALGGKLAEIRPGFVEVHLPFSRAVMQQHGLYHGGMVTTAADTASGYAAYTVLDPDEECLSVEFKINFLKPARGENLIARGSVLKIGRALVICEATVVVVRGGKEIDCALMLHTLARAKYVKSGEFQK